MSNLISLRRKYLVTPEERKHRLRIIGSFAASLILVFLLGSIAIGINNKEIPKDDDPILQDDTISQSSSEAESKPTPSKTVETPKFSENASTSSSVFSNPPEQHLVTKVVDGDTIYVADINTRIRLIGINTPETVDSAKPIQCYGPEASKYLENLILGQKVGLEFDEKAGDLDIHNRPLRYVYYNGENISYKLVYEGYAYEADYGNDYKYSKEFKQAEVDASTNKRGLWSPETCNGQL